MTDLQRPLGVDQLAAIAVELACRIRDYDPTDNAQWLTRRLPNPTDWFRLTFVLAAAIPDDRTWTELTAWTRPPPARPARPARKLTVVPEPRPARVVQPHGTLAAVSRHRYHREPLCPACREASRTYDRERQRARRAHTDRRTA